jgi:hypothetical protein
MSLQSPHTPTVSVGFCDECAQCRSFTEKDECDRFERHEHGGDNA